MRGEGLGTGDKIQGDGGIQREKEEMGQKESLLLKKYVSRSQSGGVEL